MEKIKNLSIRKTIILYMFVCLLLCFLLSAVVAKTAVTVQLQIWMKYIDADEYSRIQQIDGIDYEVSVLRPSRNEMSSMDWHISEVCDFLETYGILVISSLGTVITVSLFYRNKIRTPLSTLKEASRLISKNELDFSVSYSNKDEMGQLCLEFERMRGQLAQNNRELWKMVEQEKALRSAVSHDIRSPLAVMRGYQEMLLEFVPEDALDKEKILEMLRAGMHQIERMDAFTDTMQKLSRLEDRKLLPRETDLEEFTKQCRKSALLLAAKAGKKCTVTLQADTDSICIDSEIAAEVLDNLLSNALRFARNQVNATVIACKGELRISVQDDGGGFSGSPEELTKAYYHANPQDDLQHFGLGLYLCRIYCEKHGGKLLLGNRERGGAIATAVFHSVSP